MLRYKQALITQVAQTAVCNRHHSIDPQLCRWLLLSNRARLEKLSCECYRVVKKETDALLHYLPQRQMTKADVTDIPKVTLKAG